MASLALVSTWIGYKVGLMEEGPKAAGVEQDAYAFFIEGMGYRFYSVFTILFVGAVAMMGRDFGPMLAAERRAGIEERDRTSGPHHTQVPGGEAAGQAAADDDDVHHLGASVSRGSRRDGRMALAILGP